MGTETYSLLKLYRQLRNHRVKLNNPLMGTETPKYLLTIRLFCIEELN